MKSILCVCNYGQVRSATMAQCLRDAGFPESFCIGAMNQQKDDLDQALQSVGLIIVCNHIELEELYSHENFGKTDQEKKDIASLFTDKYKTKVLIAPIGRDIWGAPPGHPELVKLCNEWIKQQKQYIGQMVE